METNIAGNDFLILGICSLYIAKIKITNPLDVNLENELDDLLDLVDLLLLKFRFHPL